MSHFSVLVVTPEQPTEEDLHKILAPWHEFECTGLDNEYVQDVDITEEARESYKSDTVHMVTLPDGTIHNKYKDEIYDQIRKNNNQLPAGWTESEVPATEIMTFAEFIEYYHSYGRLMSGHDTSDLPENRKYGYYQTDDQGEVTRVIYRTNPNKKWDWWVIGGRWSGLLRSTSPGLKGRPGLMGSQYDEKGVDQCRRGTLDLDSMVRERVRQRRRMFQRGLENYHKHLTDKEAYDPELGLAQLKSDCQAHSQVVYLSRQAWEAADKPGTFRDFLDSSDLDSCAIWRRLSEKYGNLFAWELDIPEGIEDVEKWINSPPALSCWAVVHEGQWYEKGSMGWWGMSINDLPEHEWQERLHELVLSLPDDTWLTVVDCHI